MEWSREQKSQSESDPCSKIQGFLKSNFSNRDLNPLKLVLGTKLMESTEKAQW